MVQLRSSNEDRVLEAFRRLARGREEAVARFRDESGCSLLHLAALYGQGPLAATLALRHPQLVNEQDDDEQTPLHLALLARRNDIAATLLSVGASTRRPGLCGEIPLTFCLGKPVNYLVLTLLKHREGQPEAQLPRGFRLDLHEAYNLAMLEWRSPSPLLAAYTGRLPLYALHSAMFRMEMHLCRREHAAARALFPALSRLLAAAPAAEGAAFIRRLVSFSAESSLVELLREGPMWYPGIQHELVARGYANAYLLLAARVPLDIDEQGRFGNTVLHEACFAAGRHPICAALARRLVRRGANPFLRNDAGRTAAEVAPPALRRALQRIRRPARAASAA